MTDHAARYLAARKLDPSPANLEIARRRVARAGRLAELGAHLIPGVIHVETVETGDVDHMAPGTIFARVVLDAPERTWQAEAEAARVDLVALAAQPQHQLRLIVAFDRATPRDRRRERVRWALGNIARRLGLES